MEFIEPAMGALLIAGATSFGAALVLLIKKVDRTVYSALLSFAAGVMAFSIIEMFGESWQSEAGGAIIGFLFGVGAIALLERAIPHAHGKLMRMRQNCGNGKHRHMHLGRGNANMRHECGSRQGNMGIECPEEGHKGRKGERKSALLAGAVILHNIPEGLAVGFAFASSGALGWLVATSIAVQDIPEGLLVSAPLACYCMKNKKAVGFGVLSGVAEGVAAIFGFLFLSALAPLVPFALSLSAGAMAYVVAVELLPDAFKGGKERVAAIFLIAGFAGAFALAQFFAA
ncbi:hypothetical protein COU37_01420 [Candidatus Micrarchaeota archaeon CG10_big_fil_rev_8_21_14_0_10_45_29]|nr:MAG: hypothetical protein COU37_01420 [Candidatus Micrarchaeota archaeon CG10_big_fil_rev_8_21_14_0_10_45_29]